MLTQTLAVTAPQVLLGLALCPNPNPAQPLMTALLTLIEVGQEQNPQTRTVGGGKPFHPVNCFHR